MKIAKTEMQKFPDCKAEFINIKLADLLNKVFRIANLTLQRLTRWNYSYNLEIFQMGTIMRES